MKYAWLVLLLAGCSVELPNIRVCAVSGTLLAGADCAYTNSDDTEEMDFEEFMDFLEPRPERPDPKNPKKKLPAHGAALIVSPSDWTRQKNALELACQKLGNACTLEMKQTLQEASGRVDALQTKVNKSLAKGK